MATTRETLIPEVKVLVKDGAQKLAAADYPSFLQRAVDAYSAHRPRVMVKDYNGDGSTYKLTLPSDWEQDFSTIQSVEYPQGDRIPTFLDADEYDVRNDTEAVKVIWLFDLTPASGKKTRVTYTIRHTLSDVTSTIPGADESIVTRLAASYACEALAAIYAQTSDPLLSADTVNYRSKSQEYRDLAKQYRKGYDDRMGAAESLQAAGGYVEWDTLDQTGFDRIYHPRRRR